MGSAKRCILLSLLAAGACQSPEIGATATPAILASPTRAPTSTPSPSPAPPTLTASPPPAPRVFTDEFPDGLSNWSFLQAAAGEPAPEPEVTNGFLKMAVPYTYQWLYEIYHAHTYDDVRIDARVELGAGGQGAAGLMCRYDQTAGWYEFNIHADQTYTLLFGQWLAEGIARYTPLVVAHSEKITPSVNEIGLDCQGDVLTPYINGVQLRRRQETLHVLTEGAVGLTAASFESAPLAIVYDWVSVSEP